MTTIYIPVLVDTGDDYGIELMPYSGDNREGYEESELNQRCVLYSDYAALEANLQAAQEREKQLIKLAKNWRIDASETKSADNANTLLECADKVLIALQQHEGGES